MRTKEEIIHEVKNPTKFLKSDIYQASTMELYTRLELKDLPEFFVKKLSAEAVENWDKEEPETDENLIQCIKDELVFLRNMLKENVILPAMDRSPRVIALLWLLGKDVSNLDTRLFKIRTHYTTANDLKRKLSGLYIRIEREYIK